MRLAPLKCDREGIRGQENPCAGGRGVARVCRQAGVRVEVAGNRHRLGSARCRNGGAIEGQSQEVCPVDVGTVARSARLSLIAAGGRPVGGMAIAVLESLFLMTDRLPAQPSHGTRPVAITLAPYDGNSY